MNDERRESKSLSFSKTHKISEKNISKNRATRRTKKYQTPRRSRSSYSFPNYISLGFVLPKTKRRFAFHMFAVAFDHPQNHK